VNLVGPFLPPEWFSVFPHSHASTDPNVTKLIVVHIAELAALTMPVRPDMKN
jgi:hypothetical protein